ncbi:cytochrome P450 [Delitschia confertaspora ATCC 74209]|uniref:Cytochrome P450 n=1 Tax=Delitschia confertaspora ATCC 74209 TaxID=1513339 RepID=A0A9P4MNW0_9PLEO|nr:cytochrome P450 [Delitschia confertaspora ATCC 74209]
MALNLITTQNAFPSLVIGVSLYYILRATYLIYFHPLSWAKGSKVAAFSTKIYEYWWNIHQPGKLLFEIERLHKLHGPIVRIGPDELHVNDPNVFLDMTRIGSQFLKDPEFYRGIAIDGTSIGSTDPKFHRVRRQVLAPAFSPSQVEKNVPGIESKIKQLSGLYDEFAASAEPVDVNVSLKSFSLDVISAILFGKEFGVLKSFPSSHAYLEILNQAIKGAWIYRAFPEICNFSLKLPKSISAVIFPVPIDTLARGCQSEVNEYVKERQARLTADDKAYERKGQREISSVLELLLDPSSASGHKVPSLKELNDEAIGLLTAGHDTTAHAMISGLYQICKSPVIYNRLRAELDSSFPESDDVQFKKLKKLPYLTAVIKEILRFSTPVPGRLPRVVPKGGYILHSHHLPPGTVIHTSSYLLNRHPSVWGEDSYNFNPDRWLQADASRLDRYLATFNRGSRQCLGSE